MEFFKPGTRYDFLGKARPLVTMSVIIVLASWVLVFTKGINFGIDFAGGTEALAAFNNSQDTGAVKEVAESIGLDSPEVVTYGIGDEGRYFVRSRTQGLLKQAEIDKVKAAVEAKLGAAELFDATDETGEEIRVRFGEEKSLADLKAALGDAGFPTGEAVVQSQGAKPVYVLRLPGVGARLATALKAKFGDNFKEIQRLESVGSAVGKQLRNQGILAVLYALIGILLYVSFRFDLRYSPGAVLALFHDVSITIGIFSITGMEFSLPIIAALLAIVGYSLNDTIVVYDRIRESIELGLGKGLRENVNISINDCLSRTVLTSVTTFLAVLSIYIFGGGIIQNFAFAMLIGVVVGTYSSIYIASPAVLAMDAYLAKNDVPAPATAEASS
ncbi:MAG: protein translocase subunit SecF [Bradymonadia bacterium]